MLGLGSLGSMINTCYSGMTEDHRQGPEKGAGRQSGPHAPKQQGWGDWQSVRSKMKDKGGVTDQKGESRNSSNQHIKEARTKTFIPSSPSHRVHSCSSAGARERDRTTSTK